MGKLKSNTVQEILSSLNESIKVKKLLFKQVNLISKVADVIIQAYRNNKKMLAFGNGGSAADAQHFVTELVCRFKRNRKPLSAIALSSNIPLITATGNDYSFQEIFSRQVEALVNDGDVVFAISTSGNSKNVIEAVKVAKQKKAITIGLTGKTGGMLKKYVDHCICVPSTETPRIQESHILIIHILCKLIEDTLFPS